MDAVAALNEIAFWLERERAATFKVQAFRKAAGLIGGLPAAELAARTADGRLKRMKGIGNRTFEVVAQAVDGGVPDYLAALRERGGGPLATGGRELMVRLRGDLHAHSDWSDGGSPIQAMLDAARMLGREYLALTDHSPTLRIANGLSPERLAEQLDVVAAIGARTDAAGAETPEPGAGQPPVRLLSGIEVDILADGTLDQGPELLDRLDVVVASVHSKLRSDRRTMTRRMLAAIENPHTRVLGHCTGRLLSGARGTRPPSEFDAARVFKACAEHDVAIEINARPERQDPPDELIQLALEAGCLFSIDSDAHAPGQLDFLQYGAERAARNGVPGDQDHHHLAGGPGPGVGAPPGVAGTRLDLTDFRQPADPATG